MINFLRNLHRLYNSKNLTLAQHLMLFRTYHLGAVFSGFGGAITVATYAGAVIAQITMATGLIGVSLSPVGWLVIGAGFCAAVMVFSVYSYHRFLYQFTKLERDYQKQCVLENLKTFLVKKIADKTQELEKLKARLLTKGIISKAECEAKVDLEMQHQARVDAMFPCKESKYKILRISKTIYNKYDELISSINPLYRKILEFVAVYGITLAAINGLLTGAALFLGISVGHLGIIAGFATISATIGLSLSGPVGVGIICGIALVITSILLIKKFFFDEPFQVLKDKVQEQAKSNIAKVEYRSLEALENKIKELKLRERAHQEKVRSRWKIIGYRALALFRNNCLRKGTAAPDVSHLLLRVESSISDSTGDSSVGIITPIVPENNAVVEHLGVRSTL